MKKLFFLMFLFACLSKGHTYDVIFNPYGGHNQYLSNVSSNNLKGYNSGVLVSSPTYSLNSIVPIYFTLQGTTTAQLNLTQISLSTGVTGTISNSAIDSSSITKQGQGVLLTSSATATYAYANLVLYNSSATVTYANLNGFSVPVETATMLSASTITASGQNQIFMNANGAQIRGTNTNSTPSSGFVGEIISSVSAASQGFPSSGTYGDLDAISLTAGHWFIYGTMDASLNGAVVTFTVSGTSTSSGDNPPSLGFGRNDNTQSLTNDDATSFFGPFEVKLLTTTTYYLKYRANYSVAIPKATGSIIGVRQH